MLTVETIRKIRLAARDKKSIRQIARDLRLSRNTVRKVLRSGEFERLKSSYRDWDRQSVDILSMVPVYGLETVAGACDQALLSGSVTRDRVLICSVVPTKRKCPRRSTPRPICNCVTHH